MPIKIEYVYDDLIKNIDLNDLQNNEEVVKIIKNLSINNIRISDMIKYIADSAYGIVINGNIISMFNDLKKFESIDEQILNLDANKLLNMLYSNNPDIMKMFENADCNKLLQLNNIKEIIKNIIQSYNNNKKEHDTTLINECDNEGNTALMIACKTSNIEVIKKLLKCKDIKKDIKNKKGENALMITSSVISPHSVEIIELLLE